jgi:hypothetical protein
MYYCAHKTTTLTPIQHTVPLANPTRLSSAGLWLKRPKTQTNQVQEKKNIEKRNQGRQFLCF